MAPSPLFARETLLSLNTDRNWRPPQQPIQNKYQNQLFTTVENPLQTLLLDGDNSFSYIHGFSRLLAAKK